jgi:hypothetical protein
LLKNFLLYLTDLVHLNLLLLGYDMMIVRRAFVGGPRPTPAGTRKTPIPHHTYLLALNLPYAIASTMQ